MNRSRFQTNTSNRKQSGAVVLAQILILGITIAILAAIFVQNLQPTIQIFFLGQKSIFIPLSLAMFAAFALGSITALIINAIATWRQNLLVRRVVIAADDNGQKDKPEKKPNPPSANYTNVPKDKKQDKREDKKQENYLEDDWETEEYEDDEYEDIGGDFEDDDEYVDNDPDTVPYGDLLKRKSDSKTNNSQEIKRDRPPLDAKFIRYTNK